MSESQQPGFPILKPGKRPSMRRCISEQTSKTSKTKPKRGAKVRFIGKYQLGETFGRGKFSTVAEGTCIHTNQTFALKIMKHGTGRESQKFRKVMAAELKALTLIKHKNVIQVFGVDFDTDYPHTDGSRTKVMVIALELAPNGELLTFLQKRNAFSAKIARCYFHQLIDAMEALHNEGITHRDIKPENLLLDENFNLKVADFGLSKILKRGDDEIMKTYAGSLPYMAPELVEGKGERPYTSACDIWSCGVVLFLIRFGHSPYQEPQREDPLFNCLYQSKHNPFWQFHLKQIDQPVSGSFKDLIHKILCVYSQERVTLDEIKSHEWLKPGLLTPTELLEALAATEEDPGIRVGDTKIRVVVCEKETVSKNSTGVSAEGSEDDELHDFETKSDTTRIILHSALSVTTARAQIESQLKLFGSSPPPPAGAVRFSKRRKSDNCFDVWIERKKRKKRRSSSRARRRMPLRREKKEQGPRHIIIEVVPEGRFEDFLRVKTASPSESKTSTEKVQTNVENISFSRVEFQHAPMAFVDLFKPILAVYDNME
ncbi:hypothetical protein AAMO2058_000089200 [Amorphochlora amoebiformis]|mmetsp:Transcript_33361/g.53622  ORF Transcript_33361/g.53622 Transcript_33361/m.53622 type:complete len:543 (-) Transcript_33361:80-1708(-)